MRMKSCMKYAFHHMSFSKVIIITPIAHIYLLLNWIWIIFHTDFCPWLKDVSRPWARILSLSSRSQCTCRNFRLGHNLTIMSRMWLILLTILVQNSRVWHNFVPSSKSQCSQSQNLFQGYKFLRANMIWMVVHIIFVYNPKVCHVMTLAVCTFSMPFYYLLPNIDIT